MSSKFIDPYEIRGMDECTKTATQPLTASIPSVKQIEENQQFSNFINQTKLFLSYRVPTIEEQEEIYKVTRREWAKTSIIGIGHPIIRNDAKLFLQFERRGSFTYCYLLSYRPQTGQSELRVGATVISGCDLFRHHDNQQVANNIALARAIRSEAILKL